jgi:hypothetical protein
MILYDLACRNGHVFEAWFASGAAFESQRKARKIGCPDCGDHRVKKAPMAPRIAKGAQAPVKAVAAKPGMPPEMRQALRKLRETVESNCDYVGPSFSEEARRASRSPAFPGCRAPTPERSGFPKRLLIGSRRSSIWKEPGRDGPRSRPTGFTSPSSRGLGHRPLTAATGVRIPVGTPGFRTSGLHFPNFSPISVVRGAPLLAP